MQIRFTKGKGKYDEMQVTRNGVSETVACPKQRIIPHDMVHFAVERTLQKRGFLTRVRDGEPASFQMAADPESDGVERLVEVIQGDAWSGSSTPPQDVIGLYEVTCIARGCPPLPIGIEDVLDIRLNIRQLDAEWQALGIGQSMGLTI